MIKFTIFSKSIFSASVASATTAGGILGYEYLVEPTTIYQDIESAEKLNGGEYEYMVARFVHHSWGENQHLINETTKKQNYECVFEKSANNFVSNQDCKIFWLSKDYSSNINIDLKAATDSNNGLEIIKKHTLFQEFNYLIRVSKKFNDSLKANNQKGFLIFDKTEPFDPIKGTMFKVQDLTGTLQNITPTEEKSNLFVIKAAKSGTGSGSIDDWNSVKCEIDAGSEIACTVYRLKGPFDSLSKHLFENVITDVTKASDFIKDKYYIIQLKDEKKALQDLNGKTIKIKQGTTEIVTASAEILLMGSMDRTTPNKSNVFLVSKPTTQHKAVEPTVQKSFVLSKSLPTTKPDFLSSNLDDYLCRVSDGNTTYDDEACKFYPFAKDASSSFNAFNYSYLNNSPISNFSDWTSSPVHIVELSKTLESALKKPTTSIELISKDRRDGLINNKLTSVPLLKFMYSNPLTSSIKSNVFLAKYKSDLTTSIPSIGNTDSLTCKIDKTVLPCNVYKFPTKKTSNNIETTDFEALSQDINLETDIGDGVYLTFELTSDSFHKQYLENNTISLYKGTELIGKFTYDQLLYGKPGVIGLPEYSDYGQYIVEKKPSQQITEGFTSYTCRFPGKDSISDNYDTKCKLIKLEPKSGHTVIDNFSTSNTEITSADLSASNSKSLYKLILNNNLIYNLKFDADSKPLEDIELLTNDGQTITFTIKLNHIVDDEDYFGKSNLLLVKALEPTATTDQSSTLSLEGKAFTTKKVELTGSSITKLSVIDKEAGESAKYDKDSYFMIQLTQAIELDNLSNKTAITFNMATPEGETDPEAIKQQHKFELVALYEGSIEKDAQKVLLKDLRIS